MKVTFNNKHKMDKQYGEKVINTKISYILHKNAKKLKIICKSKITTIFV